MNAETMSQDVQEAQFLLSPLGQYFRYIFVTHLRHLTIVSSALLSLALTIDLVPQISRVIAHAPPGQATAHVAILVVVRAADLFPRFLPLAVFFAVLWTEIIQTVSRERILIWNTGRTVLYCLVPVLALGILLAPVQYAFDSYLRPKAIGLQTDMQLGSAGEYYTKVRTAKTSWFALGHTGGHDLVRGEMVYKPGIVRHAMIYRLDDDGHLREIDSAEWLSPLPKGWLLHNGQYWTVPLTIDAGGGLSTDVLAAGPADAVRYLEKSMDLDLDPVWVRNFGIDPNDLPQATLLRMYRHHHDPEIDAFIHAQIQINRATAFMPMAMALFATVLSLTLFPYAVDFLSAFLVVLAGYGGYFLMRTLSVMGQQNFVPPFVASWFTPLLLIGIASALVFNAERKRRARERERLEHASEEISYGSHVQG
jgi:lipopolysaccharide export LptBFGC system permease protein LptF